MEMYSDLFNKMTNVCFRKCASRKHKDTVLHLGETSCLDRCVAKYMDAQKNVGVVLQKATEAQAMEQQRIQDLQKTMGGG